MVKKLIVSPILTDKEVSVLEGKWVEESDIKHPIINNPPIKFNYEKLIEQNQNRLSTGLHRLQLCQSSIRQSTPLQVIDKNQDHLNQLSITKIAAVKQSLLLAKHQLAIQARSLDTLSPLKTLSRGFAKVSKQKKLISSIKQLATGDTIDIALSDGTKQATIIETR